MIKAAYHKDNGVFEIEMRNQPDRYEHLWRRNQTKELSTAVKTFKERVERMNKHKLNLITMIVASYEMPRLRSVALDKDTSEGAKFTGTSDYRSSADLSRVRSCWIIFNCDHLWNIRSNWIIRSAYSQNAIIRVFLFVIIRNTYWYRAHSVHNCCKQ